MVESPSSVLIFFVPYISPLTGSWKEKKVTSVYRQLFLSFFFFLGDFNGLHLLWSDSVTNSSGRLCWLLPSMILTSAFSMYEKQLTHFDTPTNFISELNLSICSSIDLDFSWRVR